MEDYGMRSGYSPGSRASKNYLPGHWVNNLLLARKENKYDHDVSWHTVASEI